MLRKEFKGIGASPGIGIGKVFIYKEEEINGHDIDKEQVENEKLKLLEGRNISKKQLEEIRNNAHRSFGGDKGAIFDSHITILEDEIMYEEIVSQIEDKHYSAVKAVKSSYDNYIKLMSKMKDSYFSERISDIKDISRRWIYNMLGMKVQTLDNLFPDTILLSEELSPSDISQMDINNIKGIISEIGGKTSHSSLIATSLLIPFVVGIKNIIDEVTDGDVIIIDGFTGDVIVNPNCEELERYKIIKDNILNEKAISLYLKNKKAITKDGQQILLTANIGDEASQNIMIENGADGVGLFRTEFLFMNKKNFPTEEEQYLSYKKVVEVMKDKPVTFRTLDIGGDKPLPYLKLPKEANPFLGYRAIRIGLDRPELLKSQMRAILRSSAHGTVKIMIPMIVSISEVRKSKEIFDECKRELLDEEIPFDEKMKFGIMVETPAVVINADDFAKEVDFFSIGTNDLIQFILAVDRGNEVIERLYDPYDPAVLKSIKILIDAAHKQGMRISMCGAFASDQKAIKILIGMGLDEFSMYPSAIPMIKKEIMNLDKNQCELLAKKVLKCKTSEEVKKLI
ncbi:phosphoenolpyruvate--protein phosphotransferase [Fusobacterium sp. PH5-44]|uniref:phosphoenolpyruvate--protein phosphotransferase n=1 Tax=unclassified Fusobacterium TaxID=2648384 RepID=UPI003D1F1CD2